MAATKPKLLFDNILVLGTLSATSEASGAPIGNIRDNELWSTWIPTSSADQNIDYDNGSNVTADAICFANHDFGTQTVSIEVFHSPSAGFTSGAVSVGTFTFASNDTKYLSLTSGTDRFWRIALTSIDAVPFIGQIFLGPELQMPVLPQDGFDTDLRQATSNRVTSRTGQALSVQTDFINRLVRMQFRFLTQAFVTASLVPFHDNFFLRGKPFFLMPDLTLDSRAFFLQPPENPRAEMPSQANFRHWTLEADGLQLNTW